MNAHELFASLPSRDLDSVLIFLQENDKPAYRASIQVLTTRRKLRPLFIERRPPPERHLWMREALSRPANQDAATEVLQAWLFGAHGNMICDFLDSLKIPHNGKGLLENLPSEPSSSILHGAIDALLVAYPAPAVIIYLNLFASMDIADWPELTKMLETDPRLCPAPHLQNA